MPPVSLQCKLDFKHGLANLYLSWNETSRITFERSYISPPLRELTSLKNSICGTWKSFPACHFLWLHLEVDINFASEDQKPAACKPNVHIHLFHPFSH